MQVLTKSWIYTVRPAIERLWKRFLEKRVAEAAAYGEEFTMPTRSKPCGEQKKRDRDW